MDEIQVRGPGSEVGLPEHRVDLAYQGTSIQEQAARSEVYKRMFTSHQSAQNLPRNAWTTYDPRYN